MGYDSNDRDDGTLLRCPFCGGGGRRESLELAHAQRMPICRMLHRLRGNDLAVWEQGQAGDGGLEPAEAG